MANPVLKGGALLNPQNLPAGATPDGTERIPALQATAVGGSDGNTVDEPVTLTSKQVAALGLPTKTISDATYTLTQDDIYSFLNFTGASVTLTVPDDSTADIAVESVFNGMYTGSGTLTVAAGGSATVNSSGSMVAVDQNGVLGLKKYAANTWILFGTLA